MSATSPVIHFDTRRASAPDDLRLMLTRLTFRRRLGQFIERVLIGLATVLGVLCFAGIVDYAWPTSRGLRIVFLVLLLLAAFALFAISIWSLLKARSFSEIAREVERVGGLSENALVTFAETVENSAEFNAQPYMLARLEGQAYRNATKLDQSRIAPRPRATRGVVLLIAILTILAFRIVAPSAFARETDRILFLKGDESSSRKAGSIGAESSLNAIAIENFRVRVVPPAYSGLSVEEAIGDAPVRALVGSQIEIELKASGTFAGATLSFGGMTNQMRALGDRSYTGSFQAQVSGAFETRIVADLELAPSPVVRAVEVYSDMPPEVRITEPASDQLLRGLPAAPVNVRWTARDDLEVADVTLKYIKSRGEGDAAQFTSGSAQVGSVDRSGGREWRGGAALDLARLGLQAGDTLVYWLEARDRNPTANNLGRSATLAIAIVAPEPVKLNLGDLGPNEIGRFLLSQRMIIIKTEKLHAERSRLSREELSRRAQQIAGDQREFKNSFNDYIKLEGGGDESHDANSAGSESVEERVQEAEEERTGVHMHGIPEPPAGTPSNVRDMVYAIRAMWDAEDALSQIDTAKALVYEREALTRLKRAQLAVRYVPPVFARSKPIDLKRRYAGELNEIKTRLERLTRRPESKETTSLRAALTEAYAALSELQTTLNSPVTARASAVARAREKTQKSANTLATVGGVHAATIAEAMGQLRIVESELSRLDVGGTAEDYATRVSKSLSLLTQAAANLFAIAEARTRANGGEANTLLPTDDAKASEYFRRLNK